MSKNLILKCSNEEIIDRYTENYKNSDQSVKMRKSSLNYFFEEKYFGYKEHISDITKSTLLDYFNYLKQLKKITLTTKKNKWRIMTSFLDFCMEYYDDFFVKIPSKTINWGMNHMESNSNKTILATEKEIEKILEYLNAYNYKMHLVFWLFVETGIRKGELINIEYPNVNIEMRYLKTKGKTGEKIYFFSSKYALHLNVYLKERKLAKTSNNYLFINNRREQYSTREFNAYLKRAVLPSIGIEKDITCHVFRRTLNTLRKKKGCDNDTAKLLLGHKTNDVNIESYTIYDLQDKLALFDKYYPYRFLQQN